MHTISFPISSCIPETPKPQPTHLTQNKEPPDKKHNAFPLHPHPSLPIALHPLILSFDSLPPPTTHPTCARSSRPKDQDPEAGTLRTTARHYRWRCRARGRMRYRPGVSSRRERERKYRLGGRNTPKARPRVSPSPNRSSGITHPSTPSNTPPVSHLTNQAQTPTPEYNPVLPIVGLLRRPHQTHPPPSALADSPANARLGTAAPTPTRRGARARRLDGSDGRADGAMAVYLLD